MKSSLAAKVSPFALLFSSLTLGCGGGGGGGAGDVSCDSPASVTAVSKSDHLCAAYTGLTPSAAMAVRMTCETIGNVPGITCDLKGAVAGCKWTSPNGDGTTFTGIRWAYDGTVASIMAACSMDETLVMPTAGSGSGGQTSNANVNRFLGTWEPTSGTSTTTCGGVEQPPQPVVGELVWAAGTSSDLVLQAGGKGLKANVVASTATGLPGQVLTQTYATFSLTYTQKTFTFTLGADGLTAIEDQSIKYKNGANDDCDVVEHATFQKKQ